MPTRSKNSTKRPARKTSPSRPKGRGNRGGGFAEPDVTAQGLPSDPAAARDYLASLVDASREALLVVDAAGLVEFCNAAACRLFANGNASPIGQPVASLLPCATARDRWSGDDGGWPCEMSIPRPDGREQTVLVHRQAIVLGGVRRYGLTCCDITAARAAGRELAEHRDRLEALAAARGNSIADLHARLQRRLELADLAARVSGRLLNMSPENAAAEQQAVLAEVGRILRADMVSLVEYEEAADRVALTRLWYVCDGKRALHLPQVLRRADLPWVTDRTRRGEVVQVEDAGRLPPEAATFARVLQVLGVRSAVLVPVLCRQRLWGSLGLAAGATGHRWDEEEIRTLRLVGEGLAGARMRAEAEGHLLEHLRQERLLSEAAVALGRATTRRLKTVGRKLLGESLEALRADAIVLARTDAASGDTRFAYCVPGGLTRIGQRGPLVPGLFTPAGRKARARQATPVPDVEALPPEAASDRTVFRRLGMRSGVVLPITLDKRGAGCLALLARQAGRTWTPGEERTARLLATLLVSTSARRETQEAVRRSEEKFRGIYHAIPQVMTTMRRAGDGFVLVDANETAIRQTRGRVLRSLGRPVSEFLTGLPRVREALEACDRTGRPKAVQHWFVSPYPGTRRYYRTMFFPIEPDLVISCSQDLTRERLLEEEILNVTDAERLRLGRDLHDTLGQQLAGSALMAEACQRRLAQEGHREAVRVGGVAAELREALAQARALARGLAPLRLQTDGLAVSIEHLALRVAQTSSGVVCRFEQDGELPSSDNACSLHLYHIAQEALANALRHANASSVTIRLGCRGAEGCLEVIDDGRGFTPARPGGDGIGLRTMNFRAGILGGKLKILSRRGHGTTVRCVFPVAPGEKTS